MSCAAVGQHALTRCARPPQVNKAKRDKEPAVADARSSHTDDDESGDEVDDHSEVEAAQADEIDLTVRCSALCCMTSGRQLTHACALQESGTSESDGDE